MSRASDSRMEHLAYVGWRAAPSPLKRQRLAQRRSLDELAAAAGIGRATIVRAEAGHTVSDATWWALSDALQVPREWIDPTFAERVRPDLFNLEG